MEFSEAHLSRFPLIIDSLYQNSFVEFYEGSWKDPAAIGNFYICEYIGRLTEYFKHYNKTYCITAVTENKASFSEGIRYRSSVLFFNRI